MCAVIGPHGLFFNRTPQGMSLDFPELVFRRIDQSSISADDYIQWANALLEAGSDAPSIWELAVCRWEPYVDSEHVERLFQSCVVELGLDLPSDWYAALCAYSSSICENMLRGVIQPHECLTDMLTIADDHYEPYIHWIWVDLSRDLAPEAWRLAEDIRFNGVLDLQNADDCIRRVALQFVALCTIPLPEKFPWVWICQDCDAISDESTLTEMTMRTCTTCGAIAAMRNMRFFQHRAALLKRRFVSVPVNRSE